MHPTLGCQLIILPQDTISPQNCQLPSSFHERRVTFTPPHRTKKLISEGARVRAELPVMAEDPRSEHPLQEPHKPPVKCGWWGRRNWILPVI